MQIASSDVYYKMRQYSGQLKRLFGIPFPEISFRRFHVIHIIEVNAIYYGLMSQGPL